MKKYILWTIAVVLLLCSCTPSDIISTFSQITPSPQPIASQTPKPTPTAIPTPIPEREGLSDLKSQLSDYISSLTGDWGVYIKNLNTNEYLTINEHQMYSASLIKLFIMAATYKAIDNGTLARDKNIDNWLKLMITESDNDSANMLCTVLGNGDMLAGFDFENENTKALDCTYTIQNTDLQEYRSNSTIEYRGRNCTSPRDCGHLLELIYKGELINERYSDEMLNLLKNQQHRYKIPRLLPEKTVIANKTGETSEIENDTAIVYSPDCDYIISVMSNDIYDTDSAVDSIQIISETVYNYFNPTGEQK